MRIQFLEWSALLICFANAGCAGGGGSEGPATPACETNLTATFTMHNDGNTGYQLYLDGSPQGVVQPGGSRTATVDVGVLNVYGILSEGPLSGTQVCDNVYAMDLCEETSITCGVVVTAAP